MTVLLFSTMIAGAVAAACGGGQTEPQTPNGVPTPSATTSAGTGPTAPPTTDGGAIGANAPTAPSGQQAFTGPMKPFAASTMLADVQAIGLDAKNLPPLNKMEPDKLRKVMRTFTKALGAKCTDCHNEGDFAAPTPMKNVAAGMWDHFVRELQMADGSPVYCDSCHQGRMKTLDRTDKKALSKWMNAEFVDKMKRKDGKDHGCETCHGDPIEGEFLKKWAASPAPAKK